MGCYCLAWLIWFQLVEFVFEYSISRFVRINITDGLGRRVFAGYKPSIDLDVALIVVLSSVVEEELWYGIFIHPLGVRR